MDSAAAAAIATTEKGAAPAAETPEGLRVKAGTALTAIPANGRVALVTSEHCAGARAQARTAAPCSCDEETMRIAM